MRLCFWFVLCIIKTKGGRLMLSLLITSTESDIDFFACYEEIIKTAKAYDKDIKVLFFARENDKYLPYFAKTASEKQNTLLLVADYKTTDDEMTYMGLDILKGTNTLLLSIDTLPDVLISVIEKQRKGFEIVRVREMNKTGKDFFSRIGILAYNFGLKLFGKKNSDSFCEPKVAYFDGRIVNSLSKIVEDNKQARITNCFPQVKNGLIEQKQGFREKKAEKTWNMFGYGILTFCYLLILVALLTIYPIFNNMLYSWWMIVAIVLWIAFGFLEALLIAKKVFLRRCGYGNRVDNNGEPMFDALYSVTTGDEVDFEKITPQTQQTTTQNLDLGKPVLKSKTKNVKTVKKQKKLRSN